MDKASTEHGGGKRHDLWSALLQDRRACDGEVNKEYENDITKASRSARFCAISKIGLRFKFFISLLRFSFHPDHHFMNILKIIFCLKIVIFSLHYWSEPAP